MTSRLLAFASAVVAALAVPIASSAEPAAGSAAAEPVPLGARATTRIARAVEGLDGWVKQQGGRLGVSVVDLQFGTSVADVGAMRLLNPASNQKLVTAAAVLVRLGPQFRFTTSLYGEISGESASTLTLRGDGDPSLRSADLWRLARVARDLGLKRVLDGIEVDQTAFDAEFVPPAFEQQPNEWAAFRAPISAVAVDRNAITLNVLPGPAGRSAKVWCQPEGFLHIRGAVTTRPKGHGLRVRLTMNPNGGQLEARVGGSIGADHGRARLTRRVDDPRLVAGYVFAQLLRQQGIEVPRRVALGRVEQQPRLSYIKSSPASVLLHALGKGSDNFTAEMLLKALGGETRGRPASSKTGAAEAAAVLKELGVRQRGTRVVNGSGLFRGNRISAASITALLAAMYSSRFRHEFMAHLAIGGRDGTLRSRFRDTPGRSAVRAKTGTLNSVVTLSGYVMAPHDRSPVAFSILVNGVVKKPRATRSRIDAVVREILHALWGTRPNPKARSAPGVPPARELGAAGRVLVTAAAGGGGTWHQ